ncbi:DUF6843 domain-containing protein [Candidatus Pristimantibacillus sp. PTI5]|uniref:DUF6843 domain-containing protein n=1 Tax=Candidatus Pristimantibacillus sp. PTI5 TaxID=3400422 RepID=UPI003B01FF76
MAKLKNENNSGGVLLKSIIGLPKYVFVALAILLMGFIFLIATINKNPLHIYLLPENFTGEVEITFAQADYPPLKIEKNIYNVPTSGKLKTSTNLKGGPVEVYYVDNQGHRKEVIHEEFHGVSTGSGGKDNLTVAHFYIGTKDQYDNYVKQLGF